MLGAVRSRQYSLQYSASQQPSRPSQPSQPVLCSSTYMQSLSPAWQCSFSTVSWCQHGADIFKISQGFCQWQPAACGGAWGAVGCKGQHSQWSESSCAAACSSAFVHNDVLCV
jgi:hypothetical protein